MPVTLQVSSSLRTLAQRFTRDLSSRPRGVFEPDYVVTQTEGMNNFLRLQIAHHAGITANCKFLGPNEIIQQAFRLLSDENSHAVSVPQMRWQIYGILGKEDFQTRFPNVVSYYQNPDGSSDLKRLELAEKVAVLFDQYQIYRPQIIRQWNRPQAAPTDWQQYLWQEVTRLSAGRLSDKARISDAILYALKSEDNVRHLCRHMPVVHVFGISILTDYHISLLHALAGAIDIHFYLLDPAAGMYWYEDRNEKQLAILQSKGIDTSGSLLGNPLLTSWGRVVQDTFKLLFRHEAFLNNYDVLLAPEKTPQTLLEKIQDDIHNGYDRHSRNPISETELNDGSLVMNACYTPLREVEALYNHLLCLYEKGKRFSPQDVLVMVSDINTYAPYIKAVFQNAPYEFRFNVSDENPQGGDTLTDALSAILALNADNFKPEEVAQLLDFSAVRERFVLHDTALVRRLIDAANIRFGLDGDVADDTRFVSWRYGLQRIVYGACMSGEELCLSESDEPFHPLDCVEGQDAETAIRFAHFAGLLMQHLEERYRPRDIAKWVEYVERIINDLLADTGEEVTEELQGLLAQLNSYNNAHEYMKEAISYEVFSRSFLQGLKGASQSGCFGYGGITFCSMVPMRSVPFKIVAMLGMDADKFPRRETVTSFSKLNERREVGDRNVRDNDRHLFLETILSAEEHLYISYLGRAAQDNTPQPPSPLVEELLDYVEEGLETKQPLKDFVAVHPLHNFSGQYNCDNPRLRDFLRQRKERLKSWTVVEKEEAKPLLTKISLKSLSGFCANTLRFWYGQKLGIRYEDTEAALADMELLHLNNLQRAILKKESLSVEPDGGEEWRIRKVRNGLLPLSSMSTVVVEELEEEVREVKALLRNVPGFGKPARVPVEILLENGIALSGILDVYEGGLLCHVCLSKDEVKHRMEAGILYLAAVAAGVGNELYFVSAQQEKIFRTVSISKEEARALLTQMTTLFLEGREQPLVFSAGMVSCIRKKDPPPSAMTEDNFCELVGRYMENGIGMEDCFRNHHRQELCTASGALQGFRRMYEVFYEGTEALFEAG